MGSYGSPARGGHAEAGRVLIPLGPVLEHYGVSLKGDRWGEEQVCCPVHGERRPSLTVNTEKGVAFCFACNFKGNAIHLVMAMESCDREQALERLEPILRDAGHDMARKASGGRYRRPDAGGETRASGGRKYVPPGRR